MTIASIAISETDLLTIQANATMESLRLLESTKAVVHDIQCRTAHEAGPTKYKVVRLKGYL